MREGTFVLAASVALIAACGGAADSSSNSAPAAAAGPSPSAPSYGIVYAKSTNEFMMNGQPGALFGASVFDPVAPRDACSGATATAGACCYVPGSAEPTPTRTTPGLPAGATPDGRPNLVMKDIGALELTNVTQAKVLATQNYGQSPSGFGTAEGYATSALNPLSGDADEVWRSGDLLRLRGGAGSDLGAFEGEVKAVALPSVKEPAPIATGADVVVTWIPDPSATKAVVTLSAFDMSTNPGVSHGVVTCTVDPSAGSVTIGAALLASFHAGDKGRETVVLENETHVAIGPNQITFAAQGERSFDVDVH